MVQAQGVLERGRVVRVVAQVVEDRLIGIVEAAHGLGQPLDFFHLGLNRQRAQCLAARRMLQAHVGELVVARAAREDDVAIRAVDFPMEIEAR
jgi:hypothetical protein